MQLGFVLPVVGPSISDAMRRVGRSGVGWLWVEGPAPAASFSRQDEGAGRLWSIARRAAEDADRDPDALKTAMRINLDPGKSVDSVADQLLECAGEVVARTGRL